MGFFDRIFGGEKSVEFSDRVWANSPAKLLDLVAQVRAGLAEGVPTLIVFHFRAAGEQAAAALTGAGVAFQPAGDFSQLGPGREPRLGESGVAVLMPSEAIPFTIRQEVGSPQKDAALPPVAVHLVEHHPAAERDHDVLNLDRVWAAPMTFTAYVALDEPWLQPFGIDRVRKMMDMLGMDEKTLLESEHITAALRNARKRLASHVHRELPANSCEEWMHKNLPEKL